MAALDERALLAQEVLLLSRLRFLDAGFERAFPLPPDVRSQLAGEAERAGRVHSRVRHARRRAEDQKASRGQAKHCARGGPPKAGGRECSASHAPHDGPLFHYHYQK